MVKYKYNIVYIHIFTKIKHYITIESTSFNLMLQKFKKDIDYNNEYEIIEVVRL